MTIYAVVLDRSDEAAWKALEAKWPASHFVHSETVALISADDKTLTTSIADALGMNAQGTARGIVVQMDYFAGLTATSLVEWIDKNRG